MSSGVSVSMLVWVARAPRSYQQSTATSTIVIGRRSFTDIPRNGKAKAAAGNRRRPTVSAAR
jgi:hypothetical protein